MIRSAIERPLSTLVAALALTVLGGSSLLRLPVSLLPEVERPRLEVLVRAPLSQQELLHQVTDPLERRFASVAGVTSVASETGDGMALILLESEWQTDSDRFRVDVERRLEAVAGVDDATLEVTLVPGDRAPVVEVAVLGGESGAARTRFARSVLLPELARLEGAGEVELAGERPLHAVVHPSASALAARGLTALDLVTRLSSLGRAIPAGRMRDGGSLRPLVLRERAVSLRDLQHLRIEGSQGATPLSEVATLGFEEMANGSYFRLDGRDGVLLRIYRAPRANAVRLARAARERVGELASRASGGLELVVVEDSSSEVVAALSRLGLAVVAGLLLGTLVLRFLLGSWRPTLALAVVVPASIVTAFGAFAIGDVSVDVVSLAGLALAAGMLVDSSIVVLEAIAVAREQGEDEPVVMGTLQITGAVMASFATTAVVFLPLIYLQGLARAFFGVQAFAIVSSLAVALLLSLSVTPVLIRGRGGGGGRGPGLQDGGRDGGRLGYLRLLEAALSRPFLVVLGALAVAGVAVLALASLPRELVPRAGSSTLEVAFRLPEDRSPEHLEELGLQLEDWIARRLSEMPADSMSHLRLDPEQRKGVTRDEPEGRLLLEFESVAIADRALERLRQSEAGPPYVLDVEWRVERRSAAFVEALQRAGSRVEIMLSAASPMRLAELSQRVTGKVTAVLGREPRRDPRARSTGSFALAWRSQRLRSVPGGTRSLEQQVRSALGDLESGRLELAGVEPEIRVGPTLPARLEVLPVGPVEVSGTAQRVVPLEALAKIEVEERPSRLQRLHGRPSERLSLDLDRRQLPLLAATLEEMSLGVDERVELAGEARELGRSFAQLRLALLLSLVLVYLTMAAIYESLALPLVVMTTFPVAVGGALGLLALCGESLNVLSFLGIILLGGIVVNNAVVLVHRMEQLRLAGREVAIAIREAAGERYRPILMTTLTTLLGMLPLALLGGEGAELRRGLAIAVIGGLLTSTFASLVLVPVVYRWARRKP